MATRMKMLKLLQEVREFDEFPIRRPHARSAGPLLLAIRASNGRNFTAQKRFIRVQVHQTLDIPRPVPISFSPPVEPRCQPDT